MDSVEIRLLGDFVLTIDGNPVNSLRKPRMQSLLAYLVLHRDAPQFRYYLAELFWPDSPEAQAYANLRNLVFALHQALPEALCLICTHNQTLQWNPDVPLTVDILAFWKIVEQASPPNLSLESLETAVQIHRGELLPSCYDEWIIAEREHDRQLFITLLDELVGRHESLRRYPEAIAGCRKLAAVDPFNQNGYPRLMRLEVLQGETISAQKTYRDYAQLLIQELGIDPPSEMRALYEHLRHGAVQAQSQVEKAAAPSSTLPLVGRIREWQAIQALWKTAARGEARMLLFCGEAGIGKTRLVEELAGWADRQGIRTAVAHCYASGGTLPYAPVVEWLRANRLPPMDRVWLTELSRLLPELLKNNAAPPIPLSEAWQRLRLFEALARATLGAQKQILLVIEDLHWCDQDTLEWINYLLCFDPHAPLLVVGTVRSEESEVNPAYIRLVADLRKKGNLLEIELGPLNESETGQLANHVAGKTLERGLDAIIYQETEGNPLFIVETVRAELFKQGRLPGLQSMPYKTHAVLENRIRQISSTTREIVLLAATVGRAFPLEVIRQASGVAETELIRGLEEMLQRRIVREVASNTFDFSHDKLREAAFVGVSTPHRQLLHRQVAEALVSLAEDDLESKSGEIASHYEQAGRIGEAIQYYCTAAESAYKIFANELAIQYYQRAISLGENAIPNGSAISFSPEKLAQLIEKLGDILALIGRYPQAQATFERAISEVPTSGRVWRAQRFRKIANTLMQQSQRMQALTLLDQAEQALNLGDGTGLAERQEWIQIQLSRCEIFYWENQPDRMDTIHQEVKPWIEQWGRPDQQIDLLNQQTEARLRHERYRVSDETLEITRRSLDLVTRLGSPIDIAWHQFILGFVTLWHAGPLAAREWLLKGYDASVQMGITLLKVRCLAYLNVVNRLLGEVETVREQAGELHTLSMAIGEHSYEGFSHANLGWLAWLAGDAVSAERLCKDANETWDQAGGEVFRWLADWVLLAIAVERKDAVQAEKWAETMLNYGSGTQPIRKPVAARLDAALQALHSPDTTTAFQLFDQVLDLVKESREL